MEMAAAAALSSLHEYEPAWNRPGRRSAARMAAASAHEPARLRRGGGDFLEAPELTGDGPLAAQPRHGAAPRGAARRAVARAQFAAHRRGLRADVQGARLERSGAAAGAR